MPSNKAIVGVAALAALAGAAASLWFEPTIAQRLALESSTITPLDKRLEQAGLVARRRGVVDERQVQVSLTDAGRALLNQCDCLGETLLAKSAMTLDQLDALNRQVQALRAALVE